MSYASSSTARRHDNKAIGPERGSSADLVEPLNDFTDVIEARDRMLRHPSPSRHRRQVGHAQRVRMVGSEVAVHQVRRPHNLRVLVTLTLS